MKRLGHTLLYECVNEGKSSILLQTEKGAKSSDVDLKCNVFSLEDAVVYVIISKIGGLLTIAKKASNFIAPRIHRGFMP